MIALRHAWLLLPVLAVGCAQSSAGPLIYDCPRAISPVILDGKLDEPAWERAEWTDPFVDIEGDEQPPPSLMTGVKMLWDAQYLYIGAVMEEPHLWATLTEHDQVVFHDNDFEVFIDPDNDTNLYVEVEINAYNTIFDLFLVRPYSRGGPALHDWDFKGLITAVNINGTINDPRDLDQGWSVELAMPWDGFRASVPQGANLPPEPSDVWRINFSRVQWQVEVIDGRYEKVPDTPESNWVWSPQGVVNMHVPERWGFLRFLR